MKNKYRTVIDSAGMRQIEDIDPSPVDPYAVPEEWQSAYDAAVPDSYAFFDIALTAVSAEHYPDSIVDNAQRAIVQREHLAEVMRRAEHLSRMRVAYNAVEAPRIEAERKAESARVHTCSVCGEWDKTTMLRHLGIGSWDSRRSCKACADVATVIWTESQRTRERECAVRSALGLGVMK